MSLLSTLGWIWTGCCFITRDCPHLLPCTGRKTRQFSHQSYIFISKWNHFTQTSSTFTLVQSSCCCPVLLWGATAGNYPLSSIVQCWRKTTKQTGILQQFVLSTTSHFCWDNVVAGNLIRPLSGSTRSQSYCTLYFHGLSLYFIKKLYLTVKRMRLSMGGKDVNIQNNFTLMTMQYALKSSV